MSRNNKLNLRQGQSQPTAPASVEQTKTSEPIGPCVHNTP